MIVVTGGGGFIGSVLAWALNEAGHADIIIADRFGSDDKWRNIAKREFFEIITPEALPAWLDRWSRDVEAVFHLGANSSTTERDADYIISTNLNASIALWRWCAANRKKLIYASSAATYGDGTEGFDDAGGYAEFRRLKPMNLYGWSKHAFDLWAMREAAKGHAPPLWIGLKFFNVFGPNEYHKGEMMSLVAKRFADAKAGTPVRLFKSHRDGIADGEQRRDFIYVDDTVAVMRWFLDHPRASGIFNVGTGVASSFKEMITALFAALGRGPNIEYIDMPPTIRNSYQYFTQASTDHLRQAGYSAPFTPIAAAVKTYVTRYLDAPDRYR
jgi:ADP-L-glycero-D-manno-heptose 6-epimerase